MKKISMIILFMMMTTTCWAQSIKIGIVDIQYVLEKSDAGRQAIAELKKEGKQLKQRLNKKKMEIDKLRQQLERQRLMLTQEAQLDKELQYKQKVQEFKTLYATYQQKMQIRERQLREPIIKDLNTVLQDYGKKHHFTIILDKRSSGVIYFNQKIDITKEVIIKFNEAWKKRKK